MWRGWASGFAGDYDAAAAAFASVVAEAPGDQGLLARDWLARMEIARGNNAAALEQLRLSEEHRAAERQPLFLPMWAYCYGRLGAATTRSRIFAEIEQPRGGGHALRRRRLGDGVARARRSSAARSNGSNLPPTKPLATSSTKASSI